MKFYLFLFLLCSYFSGNSQDLNDIDLKEIPKEIAGYSLPENEENEPS